MKKQLMALILIIATFLCFATVSAADTQKEISLYVNGEKIHSEVPPQIINGTTLVPLRVIFEALGAMVDWNQETKTVSSTLDKTSIELTIGENTLYKNGNAISLPVPAQIIGGRTMVPVRAISEAYDYYVKWYSEIRTVTINKNNDINYVSIFNLNGEKETVDGALAAEYYDLGWNSDINKIEKVKMYAADGRTIQVAIGKVDEYKNVGWYTEPFVTLYTADGRSINVQPSQVEAHKQVGWTTEKPTIHPIGLTTMPNLDLKVGESFKLVCDFDPETTTERILYWSSSNPDIATVNSDGLVKAVSSGVAWIYISAENGVSTSCEVTVSKKPLTYNDFVKFVKTRGEYENGEYSVHTLYPKLDTTQGLISLMYNTKNDTLRYRVFLSTGLDDGTQVDEWVILTLKDYSSIYSYEYMSNFDRPYTSKDFTLLATGNMRVENKTFTVLSKKISLGYELTTDMISSNSKSVLNLGSFYMDNLFKQFSEDLSMSYFGL